MIYTITVTDITDRGLSDSRCWGYFFNLEKAKEFVVNNYTDLNEYGYWPYVVIEEVEEGVLTKFDRKEIWFLFNKETGKYDECQKPAIVSDVIYFGIG